MAKKITFNPAEIDAEINELNRAIEKYQSFWKTVNSGLSAMMNGMDPVLQRNIGAKMDSVMRTTSSCNETLIAARRALQHCKETYESADSFLAREYSNWFTDDVNNQSAVDPSQSKNEVELGFWESEIWSKLEEYKDILDSDFTDKEKMDAAIKWLNSIRKDSSTYKDYLEWITSSDVSFPDPIKDSLDFIKAIDATNKLVSGTGNYISGIILGDRTDMTSGAKDIFSSISSSVGLALKGDDKLFNAESGFLLSYGKNMVSNWIDSIQSETKVSEVYWNTFANSAVDVFSDTVCNTPSLAIAYYPAKAIAAVGGIDLQGAYEKVSDKTGFAAVTDSFSQMKDIFEENSTWENWKSGMGVIVDSVKGWFK